MSDARSALVTLGEEVGEEEGTRDSGRVSGMVSLLEIAGEITKSVAVQTDAVAGAVAPEKPFRSLKSIDSGGTFRSVPSVRFFLSEDGQRNTNKDSNSR